LGGTVRRARDNLVVRAYLEDVPSGVYVWSLKFERPADAESLLLSEIAAATTDIVYAVASSFEQPGLRLDPQSLSIFLKAGELLASVTGTNDLQAMTLLEQAIARAPAWADAHATLALALTEQIPREDFPDRLARAREEARTAIALYSGSGAGYDALFRLARFETPTNLLAAEAHLLEGLDNARTFPPLHMRHCDFLLYVGRISEALSSCERAAALRPLFAPSSVRRALALWFGGQNELALRVMEATWAQHPRQVRVSVYRFFMLAFDGPVRDAATALTQVEPQAMVFPPPVVDAFEKYFVALESGTNDDIDAALQAATEATKPNPLGSLIPIVMAAKLGRVDDAVEMFVRLEPSHLTGTSLLFSPGLKPVHRDPRFMSVMARSGHIQYWRETRKWPDFCEDPTLPYKCESEAEAVLPQT
jgi:hypothetical protein